MSQARFTFSRQTLFGVFLIQALGLGTPLNQAVAQTAIGGRAALPTTVSPQSLVGLEMPPQMVTAPKPALPNSAAPSNVSGTGSNADTNANSAGQISDLIRLYQDAAFSDPVLTAARFNYQASKELYWQGLALLLPQANATPGGTRYYQHGVGQTVVQAGPGNSRVFDQKNYTVTLTQPVFNLAALEAFKQGDLNTKIADMNFFQAQQDLILRVSQAYFDALTSQDNVELYRNKKTLIKQQLEVAQAKFDAGLATIVDVNTAQASYDLATSQEIAAQADLVVKRGVLEQLVGHPVGLLRPLVKEAKIDGVLKDPRAISKVVKELEVTDSVNPPLPAGQTLDDWIKQAEAANFKVLASQLSVSLAESTYRAAQALNYPSLNLVGTAGYNTSNGTPNSYQPAQTNVYNNTVALQLSSATGPSARYHAPPPRGRGRKKGRYGRLFRRCGLGLSGTPLRRMEKTTCFVDPDPRMLRPIGRQSFRRGMAVTSFVCTGICRLPGAQDGAVVQVLPNPGIWEGGFWPEPVILSMCRIRHLGSDAVTLERSHA